jgi:hypothetical protein
MILLIAMGLPLVSFQNVYAQLKPMHFGQQLMLELDNCKSNATCGKIGSISYLVSIPTKNETWISNDFGHPKHSNEKDATPFILPFP